jgi:hypothetical protein
MREAIFIAAFFAVIALIGAQAHDTAAAQASVPGLGRW